MSEAFIASHMSVGEFLASFPHAGEAVETDHKGFRVWLDAKEAALGMSPTHRSCGERVYHLALLDYRAHWLAAFGR